MKWFRVHHDLFTNTKFKRLSAQERYYYLHLYFLASINSERGVISDLDDEEIAFELNLETEDWLTLKAKFRVKGFIELSKRALIITKWNEEQFASDSSTERSRKCRAKKMQRCNDVAATIQERSVNVVATPPDTDPDPDPDPDPKKDSLSPKGSLSHEQPTAERETSANAPLTAKQPAAERETSANAPLTAKQPAADIDPALVYGKTKSNPGRSQSSHGQTQSSAPPPPDIFQLKCWAQFKAPGKHPAFWLDIVEQTRRFREPPANPEAAAEGWIQKQGHLLWDVFVKKQNRKLEQPLNLSDAIAAIEISLNRLGWTKTQAIAHMIEHHGWARMMLSHHSAQNLSLLNDQELLALQNVVGHLTHAQSGRNSHAL
jgi:hypothetical protein